MKRLRTLISERARTGWIRSRAGLIPAAQMAITATAAYAFASLVLGHEGPLFAATAALIALGFNREPRIRRVLEVAVGCTLGILIGDLLLVGLGSGLWQAALVLFISILLARFLDSGATFTMQMGLQAVLVVLLPAPPGGPLTRSLDAVVGAGFALLVVFLTPRDPRTEPMQVLGDFANNLVTSTQQASQALTTDTASHAWHALILLRRNQENISKLKASLGSATEMTTYSPTGRRYREQIGLLNKSLPLLDLAERSLRITLRKLASAIDNGVFSQQAREELGEYFTDLSEAVALLLSTLSANRAGQYSSMAPARDALAALATRLKPSHFGLDNLEGQAFILLLRPLLVDLLMAAGLERHQAIGYLPPVD